MISRVIEIYNLMVVVGYKRKIICINKIMLVLKRKMVYNIKCVDFGLMDGC